MPLNWQTLSKKHIARGIDRYSPNGNILEGHAESLVNVDVNAEGEIRKRPGYVSHAGWVPLRVTKLEHDGNSIYFTIDTSQAVTFDEIGDGPLLAYGKVTDTTATGDFTTTAAATWYSTRTIDNKTAFSSGSNTITKTASEHGLSTEYIAVGWAESTSASNLDSEYQTVDSYTVSDVDYELNINYTAGSSGNAYIWYRDVSASTALRYVTSVSAQTSVAIDAATHALDNFNILVKCFDTTGTNTLERVLPDDVTISTAGEVTVTFNAAFTGDIVLEAAPTANVKIASATVGSNSITIVNPPSPYLDLGIYAFNGTTYEEALADSITYDDATDTLTINYTLAGTPESVEIYYIEANVISNRIKVTDSTPVSETFTETNPQITLWGISHENIYYSDAVRPGHVNHIDSYRRIGEKRVICGLGGNLFSAQTRTEAGTTYLMDEYEFNAQNRVDGDTVLGPLFITTGGSTSRTRGVISADDIANNRAIVTTATYVSSGVADYTLSFTNKSGTLALNTQVDANDKLTVSGMARDANNGTFDITSVTDNGDTVVIRVSNSAMVSANLDEAGARGKAGVFTDKLTLDATTTLAADDDITSSAFTSLTPSVVYTSGTDVTLDGITAEATVPDGVLLYATRSTATIATSTVANMVEGDMLSVTGLDRKVRVTAIDTSANTFTIDETLSVSDGTSPTTFTVASRWIPIEAPSASGQLPKETYIRHLDTSDYSNHPIIRSAMINDSMFFTNGEDEVYKFDGTNIFRAGLPRWQPGLFAQVDGDTASILKGATIAYTASSASERSFDIAERPPFVVGDRIYDDTTAAVFVINAIEVEPGSPDSYKITVNENESVGSITGSGNLTLAKDYRYYFRLNYIDANNNRIAGATLQSDDFYVEQYIDGQIRLRLIGMPAFDNYDYDFLELETYRTAANQETFYLIDRKVMSFDKFKGYIDVIDVTPDYLLSQGDAATNVIVGGELAPGWEQPLRAKYIASANNRLLLGNVKDYDKLTLSLLKRSGKETLTAANLDNFKVLFRKDNTDTSTATNNTDRIRYEFMADGDEGISPTFISFDFIDADITAGQDTIAETSHGLRTGQAIQLTTTGTLPSALSLATTYYVIRVDADTIKLATTLANANAGTAIDIAADGSGTHTLTVISYLSDSFTFSTGDVNTADDEITETDHNLTTGDVVQFSSTTTLPAGLSASTDYYIIRVDADTIQVASSLANAEAGTAINITSTGSGTHTCTFQGVTEVNVTSHGLSQGDWIYLFHGEESTTNKLSRAGWFQAAQVSTNAFTIHTNHEGAALRTDDIDRYVIASSSVDVPVFIGTDGNFNQREGNSEFIASQAINRLAAAINATMRAADVSIDTGFVPWMSAFAGNDYRNGELVLQQPVALSTTMEAELDAITTADNFTWFGNDIERTGGTSDNVVAYTDTFPSRVIMSYANYPETFNYPGVIDSNITALTVDVNSADGQAITGLIPFFAESTFGGGQLNEVVLVFKEASVYVLDTNSGQYQILDTDGQGCTSPRSIAATKSGIIFANESGIYRINRNLSMDWVGRFVDEIWQDEANVAQLGEATGHNYKYGRKYKLSYPTTGSTYNSNVLVYHHEQEGRGQELGGWTQYDNHASTGWCNLDDDAFFATQTGDLMKVRNDGTASDYRDDTAAISSTIILKAEDFEMAGVRKAVDNFISDFTLETDVTNVQLSSRVRRKGSFTSAGNVTIDSSNESITLRASPAERKGNYFQIKYLHSTKDECIILTGVSYRMAPLTNKAIAEVAQYSG